MNQCLSGLFATRLVIQIVDYLFGKVQLIIKIHAENRIEKINIWLNGYKKYGTKYRVGIKLPALYARVLRQLPEMKIQS